MSFLDLLNKILFAIRKKSMTPTEQLAYLAKSKLGLDFTDDSEVPDDVSCAFALTTILREQDSEMPIIKGTYPLLKFLENSPKFQRVYDPHTGDIVICATGTGTHPNLVSNGHCGIYLDDLKITSNSSATGFWTQNYDRYTWRERYHDTGGYPVYLFRKMI